MLAVERLVSKSKKAVRRLKNEDDRDHFGTGSDRDRPDCLVNSNFCDGPVAVASGSKVVGRTSVDFLQEPLKHIEHWTTVPVVPAYQFLFHD